MSSGLLRLLYDYRSLLGRRDIVKMTLDVEERDQLAALEQRFTWTDAVSNVGQPVASPRRQYLRLTVRFPAQIKVGTVFADVTVVDLSGGGLLIEPVPVLRIGDLTVVKIVDLAVGREYHLPVEVAWIARGRMGLCFFGIPIELRYGGGRAGLADDAAA
jgi:hypothetical protein